MEDAAVSAKDLNPRKKALGRGLAALMPSGTAPATAAVSSVPASGYRILPIERVHPNRHQPRKHFNEAFLTELAASIKEQGVLLPLIVRRSAEGYEIVAGERRWRAATRAGLHEIPAVVKEYSDSTALQVALIENIQRQDLDPLEEAEAYGRLIREHELTHDEVAQTLGKSRSTITNSLRLLKLPEPVLGMLADGRLSAGHARALMTLEDSKQIVTLAEDLVGRRASVRDAENKIRLIAKSKKRLSQQNDRQGKASPEEKSVEERLQSALGSKVRLHHKKGKGRIEIHFHSLTELDTLLDKILG